MRTSVSCSRKVRAPQRRVAGNARPPRGEDQCHRDVAPFEFARKGSETRQTLLGARPNRRTRFERPGNRAFGRKRSRCPVLGSAARAAGQPVAEMDDRRRGGPIDLVNRFGRGTELGLQAGSPPAFTFGRPTDAARRTLKVLDFPASAAPASHVPDILRGQERSWILETVRGAENDVTAGRRPKSSRCASVGSDPRAGRLPRAARAACPTS